MATLSHFLKSEIRIKVKTAAIVGKLSCRLVHLNIEEFLHCGTLSVV